jgi:hypothetical protein
MVSRSLTLVCLAVFACSARADLDWSPRLANFQDDGVSFHYLVFSDGTGKEIHYRQPDGWTYTGSAKKFSLRPPDKSRAEGTFTSLPLTAPSTFDDESLRGLVEQALATVPRGNTELTVVSQEKNPVRIEGKETFLVILSYREYGEGFVSSFLFMNRNSEQICFRFVSRAADFEGLQRAFLASQFSWYNL